MTNQIARNQSQSIARNKSPRDYGLPYDEWRLGQFEAIEASMALLREKDIVFLIADTGTGKTGIGTAIASGFETSSILAPTIALEEQYGTITGLEVGKGRRWHPCNRRGVDADVCYSRDMCDGKCEYKRHIERIKAQKIRVLNYGQFFALNMSRSGGLNSQLVVMDEGQGVESHLQGFVEMWFNRGIPTWGSEYKEILFNNGNKFLFMSASMIPSLIAETMGIREGDYSVYEAENDFDPNRNPVWVRPVGYITNNRPHIDRIVRYIDNHLDNTTFKGIIHTSSDSQTEEILSLTRHRNRMIWPKGKLRAAMIQGYKDAPVESKPVLISAGLYEGQDFPDDQCRWQIICKVPYAGLGSPHIAARRKERPDIYRLEALQKIQQGCGRGMRSKDDWCINTILDATVIGLYESMGDKLSTKFRQSWKGVA